jgi:hypothetical protein
MYEFTDLDKNKFFDLVEYTPHSKGQAAFHLSNAKIRIACCGRRWGKSIASGHEFAFACLKPNSYYWIVGPTYKLAEKEFRVVHDIFTRKLGLKKQFKVSYNVEQGHMRIAFPWGTVVQCASATNPDSLLGEGLDGVIMSESARHSLETWEMYIEPALSDKDGFAIFPSTPRGFNWFQGLWQLGQDPTMHQYDSWRFPTWENTLRYPGGQDNIKLRAIKSTVSKAFWEQEYAAQFTSFEGQIYEEFDQTIHVKDIEYQPAWRNYWVFDWGFNDPLVCLDIMVDPSDNVYVWREYQVRHLSTWDHAIILKERENPPGFHVDAMFGDPSGADEIATMAHHFGFIAARSREIPWNRGIEAVKRKLKLQPNGLPQLFIDRSCHNLIRQLQALQYRPSKNGMNAKEGQVDRDDHGPDALRYFHVEFFILGAGTSLSSVYSAPRLGSEAETFFTMKKGLSLDDRVGF